MSKHRLAHRQPRTTGPCSDCLIIRNGEVVGTFKPKPRPNKGQSVVKQADGSLVLRISDL